ncbi:MAG TPA: VOC family protein [Methylocystis sp.]|nr:VOC family protein [Methylocystis sp.]
MTKAHGGFVWHELATTDLESAKAFYAHVVGWGAQDTPQAGFSYSLFTLPDGPVAGLMKLPEDAETRVAPHWLGYVAVDDVDLAVERLRRLGGAVYVPPADISGVSRFSIVADPQQATFALIQRLRTPLAPSAAPDAPGRVGWNELLAADWEQAFAFYNKLLGWQEMERRPGPMGVYQSFAAGAEMMGGMIDKPPTLPHPFWLYYFNVADIEAAAKRVEEAGGEILYGPDEAPGAALIAHCADAQGAAFALMERRARKPVGYIVAPAPAAAGRRA